METKKKLSLNKETIVSLGTTNMSNVNGGAPDWGECRATYRCDQETGGCSDGCGFMTLVIFTCTALNCTDGHCTRDCTGGYPETTEKEYTSGQENQPQ